ncbi:RagB/SusD family nutrient uptake outer membrane protein [Gillisia limnaea]|uniref:RagB/SusD domain-containing protein n=1 Tax=Gillisia limnaea (strain DSM 15749 / LMG 21470 / R-8282) TaxID=865937 RepID=H2BYU3_GILLR|nr:RagB/SusD family nutrient uptake outer membrane protein [Gillisia limnaea]EHQ02245.1 RagB/SusD domain-containing protein [Gillisia limnaea DSM 15749]
MKSIKTLNLGILLMAFIFTGCDDNLDLEPEQDLTPEAALGSANNIQNLLVGAYDLAGQNEIFAGSYNLASELIANTGELAWRGTFQGPAEFNRKQITTGNGFVADYWITSYAVSNQANLILENLDKFEEEEEAARVEGEAKFLRAAVYFDLLRFFSLPYKAEGGNSQLGVPLVTTGVSDASQIEYPSRNTVEEGYNFVIQDLTDAISKLPGSNPIDDFYANKFAAEALLARVYLQQGNYQGALEASNNVIESNSYSLTGNFAGAFNNDGNSTEDIFAWQITTQDGVNDMNVFWATRKFGGRSLTGDVTIEEPYFAVFNDEEDDRSMFFYTGDDTGTFSTTKWQNQFANIPFLRLAEMYLIRAESNFRLGSSLGATPVEDINTLRNRAGALTLSSATLEDILEERKRELAFEGFALHDVKRLEQSIDGLPFDANSLVLPIPQREMDANLNLEQNPGYTN